MPAKLARTSRPLAQNRAISGRKPPVVVLLHGGFGFDGRQWEPQLDQLSDEFTVVAWDSPGHGQSPDPPEHFRLPDYADCLAGFIDALELERPHIVGLSFGGGLALQFHDRHPIVARTLVVCGAYGGWAGSSPAEVVRERLDRVLCESELPPDQTLLLWGDGDQGSSVSIAEEMHDRIPGSTLVLVPGVGHVSNLEAPAAFNDALRAFLHKHSY